VCVFKTNKTKMQQLVLTRDHVSIPWGFRLKGGSEYNVPLSILKVNKK
jgi:hypothetical protein